MAPRLLVDSQRMSLRRANTESAGLLMRAFLSQRFVPPLLLSTGQKTKLCEEQ